MLQRLPGAATWVLIGNAFAFNLGFYMVLPYLASYMQVDLGIQLASIGLVLGMRVLSQQGLFLLGGWLGDRWGYRPTIIMGCVVRTAGFVILGCSHQLPGLLLGAALTGLAGALFTPTSQAYLSRLHPEDGPRKQAFMWHHWMSQAGMLLGPLAGLWTGRHGFWMAACSAAGLFALLTWVQWRVLPPDDAWQARSSSTPVQPVRAWQGLLKHRSFWIFSLWSGAYSVLFQQLYLAVPTYLQRHQPAAATVTQLFTLTAVFSIALQWPASRYAAPALGTARAMGCGLALMGLAYGSLLNPWQGDAVSVITGFALLFSAGSVLVYPLINSEVARYAPLASRARYYGLLAGVGSLLALTGNVAIGAVLDHATPGSEATVWWALGSAGVAAGLLLGRHVQAQHGRADSGAVAACASKID